MANASAHEQPSEVLASERRPWLAQPNELTSAKNSKSSEREDATHDSPSIQMADSILSAPRSTQAPKTIEKAENTKLDEPPRSAKAQKPTSKAQKRKLDVPLPGTSAATRPRSEELEVGQTAHAPHSSQEVQVPQRLGPVPHATNAHDGAVRSGVSSP